MSAPVSGPIAIGALDLAALLCSRVCHDLISPVGAIVNGLEVLEEDKDEETKTFALDLIKKSAQAGFGQAAILPAGLRRRRIGRRADRSRRCGKGGARLHRGRQDHDRLELAAGIGAEKPGEAPLEHAGGRRRRHPPRRHADGRSADGNGFRITASGLNARVTAATAELLAGSPAHPVDAHAIQPLYTGILARDCGLTVSAALEGEAVVVTAR